jgi:hypothetical protein
MGASVAVRAGETPQERLSGLHGTPAKASLPPKPGVTELRLVAKEAIQRVGKQSAAATDIGISDGRLSAKLEDGTLSLRELERLGPHYAAEFGRQLLERFGPLATPHARARQLLQEHRRIADELFAIIEHLS